MGRGFKDMKEAQRLNILYGDVLSIYGIPNNHIYNSKRQPTISIT